MVITMPDNYNSETQRLYPLTEEQCYRKGVPVDEYMRLVREQGETMEQHLRKKSRLEEMAEPQERDDAL